MDMTRPPAPSGAAAIPDARGLNLYRADSMAAALFAAYLPPALFAHLAPQLDRTHVGHEVGELLVAEVARVEVGPALDEDVADHAERRPAVVAG
ncbi:MAG TPA: hypothetical protein PKC20_06630, partial [Burkholderiaceae bacterium]|nr:hypothetical protein [Burkholderiaceae bacterium]